jgi:hypothetical protein
MFNRFFISTMMGVFLGLLLWPSASVLAQGPPPSPYQLRVTGTCPPGSYMRVINQWLCCVSAGD